MAADVFRNKKLYPLVSELIIIGRKTDTSLIFFTKSYFAVPKNTRLNSTHSFVMKIQKLERNLAN